MPQNLLKPTKGKIIANVFLGFFWVILLLSIPFFGFQSKFLSSSLIQKGITILLSFLFSFVVYYPLTCAILFVFRKITKAKEVEKSSTAKLIIAILIILIWNPFVGPEIIVKGFTYFNHNIITKPCGLEVMGFSDNSSAKDAGITIGEKILFADGDQIDSLDAFMHIMASKRPGDTIILKTEQNEYNVKTIAGVNTQGTVIGIKLNEVYCEN
jgi:hypothetical protein